MKAENKTGFIRNLPFMQLLTGEIVSAVGDTFQFVAITVLLYNLTGSGLSAAFGVICTPMTSILLSPFAGSLGDKFSEKYMLVFLDLFRAFLVTFLIGSSNTFEIYLILILLAALGTLYGPPYKKIMVHILDKKNIVAGNSIFTGVSGVVYIIGPLAASALMNRYGLDTAFYINSFSFVFSALMILFIKFDKKQITSVRKNYRPNYNLFNGIKEGFKYCRKDRQIKHLILIGTIISLGTASVNIAFYPYVFNILKVSSEEWGIMISVFYGTNLISMFLAVLCEKFFKGRIMIIVYLLFSATSVVWFMYALTDNFLLVLLLQSIEGTLLAVCGIFLGSFLQTVPNKDYVARVSGVNDIINNSGKLVGILAAYLISVIGFTRFVFTINSVFLFLSSAAFITGGHKVFLERKA